MAAAELTDGAKKVIDETDEYVCGFVALQVLDQDGYVKKQKGSQIEAPLHLASTEGDFVVLQADFAVNPLFYLQLTSEEGQYLYGRWWLGDAKWSRTNQICTLIPKLTQDVHKVLDTGTTEFTADAEMAFLKGAPSRLLQVKLGTKEQRFVTKLISASVQIPKAAWAEWKQYRLKLWRSSKSWAGEDKSGKDDEEKEKKDED